jgi:Dolichyl-phosphate-mannose-protein mannosyltransferase
VTEGDAPTSTERPTTIRGARLWWLTPPLAALLAAALAEISITRDAIQIDEAQHLLTARLPLRDLWDTAASGDLAHLTTHLLWKPWLAISSGSEEAARAPSVLFAALAAAATVLVGRRLAGWLTGAVAGTLVAVNGYVLSQAHHVSATSLTLLLLVTSTYAYLRAIESDVAGWWIAYVLLVLATATTGLAGVAVVAAHCVHLGQVRRGRLRRPLIALLLVAIGVAIFAALVREAGVDSPGARSFADDGAADVLWTAIGWNPMPVVAAAVAIAVVGLGYAKSITLPAAGLLAAWVAAPVVVAGLASLGQPTFAADDLVAVVPALSILAGVTVTSLAHRPEVAFAACMALAAGATYSVMRDARAPSATDWRTATTHLSSERSLDQEVIVIPSGGSAALQHYLPGLVVATAPTSPDIWVVSQAVTGADALVAGRQSVGAPTYALLEERSFGANLSVQHWTKR